MTPLGGVTSEVRTYTGAIAIVKVEQRPSSNLSEFNYQYEMSTFIIDPFTYASLSEDMSNPD